jgi:hypothetical protein
VDVDGHFKNFIVLVDVSAQDSEGRLSGFCFQLGSQSCWYQYGLDVLLNSATLLPYLDSINLLTRASGEPSQNPYCRYMPWSK